MSWLENTVDFFTKPDGLGFPILIGAGLGVILYLMNYTTKANFKAASKIEDNSEQRRDKNLPFKPF